MSDEIEKNVSETINVESEAATASPAEALAEKQNVSIEDAERALSSGYNPDYNGDDVKSVKEFNRIGDLIDKLDRVVKENKQQANAFNQLSETVKLRERKAAQAAIEQYEREMMEARNNLDMDAYDVASRKRHQAEQELTQEQALDRERAVSEFLTRNSNWYNDDTFDNAKMQADAIAYENYLVNKEPMLSDSKRLKKVELEIRNRYKDAEVFKNYNRQRPPAIETKTASKPTASASQHTMDDLSDIQKNTYLHIKALREEVGETYTIDQYLADI